MQAVKSVEFMQDWVLKKKKDNKTIGLVPTMGFLHEGHLALVKEARKRCDIVIVSIFVNPIQFGVGEDFEEYPRDLEKDCDLLEKENVDAVFAPLKKDMYPSEYSTFIEVNGEISQKLCGKSRPGHFKGVTTVVSKLFNICLPDLAFFGQKDAQQVMIVEKMVKELNFPLSIVRVPIVREADGLAMSSRNTYLDKEHREQALVLNQVLKKSAQLINTGERKVDYLKQFIIDYIKKSPEAEIDYVEILDADDLSDLDKINDRALIVLAVKFGTTRLIDNLLVEV